MDDTNKLCLAIFLSAAMVIVGFLYETSMICDELHEMVIPAVGDLDGDSINSDVVVGAYGKVGYAIGNVPETNDSGCYCWNWKNTSYVSIENVKCLVNVS